uniref:Iron-binding zinc finger CDGSH type domain-containing protein n=1 Tax=Strigamia maritima TaxID=126957 RepID=T1JMM0_STRMM
METAGSAFADKVPSYLSTMSGARSLSTQEWLALVGTATTLSLAACWTYSKLFKPSDGRINPSIQKDSPKVVHGFDIEDLGDNVAFCRCWRSAKFPYCDGSHNAHNCKTGDNVGPVIVKKKGK